MTTAGKSQPSPLASGIRDNRERGSVGQFLRDYLTETTHASFVSAYFTIYAYHALKDKLDDIQKLRFLFGEPRFLSNIDPEKSNKKFFKIEDEGLSLGERLEQNSVARACAAWIEKCVEIRSIRQAGLLHGKMYHLDTQYGDVNAIVGSSNFTVRGLGLSANANNIELNLEVQDKRDTWDLKAWFDEVWTDDSLTVDVKDEVLGYLEQLYGDNAPEFIYYKTLFHLFAQFLEEQDQSNLATQHRDLRDTDIWQALFEFQKDGVKGAISKIRKHGGCILADSVGLGKTYEALAVIKHFEQRNERVLVLCPKKLRENWTVYLASNNSELNPFTKDRFAYTVLSHTDLSRNSGFAGDIDLGTFNWGAYDLLVIDESHNFRNNTKGKRDEDGNVIRKSRYERLLEDIIQSGAKTKVLLLSATPVNNDLKDLRNQLYFISEGKDDAFLPSLGIANLKETLAQAQRAFTVWAKESENNHQSSELMTQLSSSFFKLLDELTIARSRGHIQRYYPDTIAKLGGFPERCKPKSYAPDIDSKGRFLSYDKLNREISEYKLALFNPSLYLLEEYQEHYQDERVGNFSQLQRENFLIGMMKVNFLKRLESSVAAFAITMERTVDKIETLIDRIEAFEAMRDDKSEIDFAELSPDDTDDDELHDAWQVGKKLKFNMAHLNLESWLEDLEQDRQQLHQLYLSAKDVTPERDAKLSQLEALIRTKAEQPTTNKHGHPNRKVLVFTAFADTAVYLYEQLHGWAKDILSINSALVVGSGTNKTTFGKSDFNHILINFSPLAKRREQINNFPQEGEIDLLIATDCISEGQNLQDCDYLVNYDIHWNPVRIIQRFGRIDRIGSVNESVQLVNFWPTEDLNNYIDLKNRVEARMALVDLSATNEDNLLQPDGVHELIEDDLRYRDKQLLRLQEEVLDLEDFNESVTLSEFTLDDFRLDLDNYIQANREQLQNAPLGLYAVVPAPADNPIIRPGVIFCLAHDAAHDDNNRAINPLHPHYLVYVRDDGEVRYTFTQPKQILDIYRKLCAGKHEAYEELCRLFDRETDNGSDMQHYNALIETAVASLAKTFKRREANNLQQRKGLLSPQQAKVEKTTDFRLISWLIIKDGDTSNA
jgi:SNF2 family DNA or RNA helicase